MLNMSKTLWVLAVLGAVTGGRAEAIRAHPDNPHFYLFRGRPTVLITSAEHYGAVINRAFDYNAYLEALKSYGLNYTRIYPAAFIEPEGTFHPDNTLAPKSEDLIQPWARSQTPGHSVPRGKHFDHAHRPQGASGRPTSPPWRPPDPSSLECSVPCLSG